MYRHVITDWQIQFFIWTNTICNIGQIQLGQMWTVHFLGPSMVLVPSPPLPLSDQVSIEYRETSPPIPARPPLLTSDFDCNTIYWLLLLKLPPSIQILLVKLIIPKQGLVVVSESFSLNRSTLSNLWQLLPLLQRLQLMLVQLSLCCLQFLETVLEKSLKSISSKRK